MASAKETIAIYKVQRDHPRLGACSKYVFQKVSNPLLAASLIPTPRNERLASK
jgi:hypothetical protein